MSAQHTQGTWHEMSDDNGTSQASVTNWSVDNDEFNSIAYMPIMANGKVVALVVDGSNIYQRELLEMDANARRIVACVNACNGLSTENLENNIPIKDGLIQLNKRVSSAESQLDSLLATLELIVRDIEATNGETILLRQLERLVRSDIEKTKKVRRI